MTLDRVQRSKKHGVRSGSEAKKTCLNMDGVEFQLVGLQFVELRAIWSFDRRIAIDGFIMLRFQSVRFLRAGTASNHKFG